MLQFHIYDVFTDTAYSGNPLAIVEGADTLTGAQMQKIAGQFNLSETIFMLAASGATKIPVRIFTPQHEMPFAGHPTIGCAVHAATFGQSGDLETQIVLAEQAGDVPVQVSRSGQLVTAEFKAPVTPGATPLAMEPDQIAGALGLVSAELGEHRAHVTTGGHPFVHIALRDAGALSRAKPSEPAFSALADIAGTGSVYVYAPAVEPGLDYEARMFAPLAGISEDPATGSATTLLAGQLLANGALKDGKRELRICQGRDMGRKSDLTLRVGVSGGVIGEVHVGGSAVQVASGSIAPPS
ncbi:MAG: PhzF family phenazine biosynthesis protein [Pseudomonadota bacterium]